MKESFELFGRILSGGQPGQPEQTPASGGTEETENSQSTVPTGLNPGEYGHGKGPVRGNKVETKQKWNPKEGCLVVETEQVLEPSLRVVMIQLTEGEIRIVETDEVQRPELNITEGIFAGSEPEASNFYQQNGSGVDVDADSDSLSVIEKRSPGVVSGGSGNVRIEGRTGSVVVVNSYVGGNISNRVNGGTGGTVIINGEQTGSSQSASRGETQVVLRVPVAKNLNEGKTPEPERAYFITVDSGHIGVENGTGRYTISAGSGDVVIKRCRMMAGSKIEIGSGGIEVTGTTFNYCRIETGSGYVAATGIFRSTNVVKTESGHILFGFGEDQGEIEVQTSSGRGVIRRTQTQSFFKGVENPNGQTATLILTTEAGEIKVNQQTKL